MNPCWGTRYWEAVQSQKASLELMYQALVNAQIIKDAIVVNSKLLVEFIRKGLFLSLPARKSGALIQYLASCTENRFHAEILNNAFLYGLSKDTMGAAQDKYHWSDGNLVIIQDKRSLIITNMQREVKTCICYVVEQLEATSRAELEKHFKIQPPIVIPDETTASTVTATATAASTSSSTSSSTSKNSQEMKHTAPVQEEREVLHNATSSSISSNKEQDNDESEEEETKSQEFELDRLASALPQTSRKRHNVNKARVTHEKGSCSDSSKKTHKKGSTKWVTASSSTSSSMPSDEDQDDDASEEEISAQNRSDDTPAPGLLQKRLFSNIQKEKYCEQSTFGILEKRLFAIPVKPCQASYTPYIIQQLPIDNKTIVENSVLQYIMDKNRNCRRVIEHINQIGMKNYQTKRTIIAVEPLAINDQLHHDLKLALLDHIEKHITRFFSNHKMVYPALLLSDANGEDQDPHRDYVLDEVLEEKISKMDIYDPQMSYSAIMAIDDFDWLWYPEDRKDYCKTISCTFPQLLLFSPLAVHAGSHYKEPRLRLFFYLVPISDPIIQPEPATVEFMNYN